MVKDETGNQYGNLRVVERSGSSNGATWLCECVCGLTTIVRGGNLRNDSTTSCGCAVKGYEKGKLGRQRVYTVDDRFFKRHSGLSNYWAGFIAADGNIARTRNRKVLRVKLAIKDLTHLKRFRTDIKASNPISYKNSYANNYSYPSCGIYITSKQIVDDLETIFGITAAKSLTLTYPKFDSTYKEDCFVLGYIDGDGFIQKTSRARIEIIGTKRFLTGIKRRLQQISNNGRYYLKPHTGSPNVYKLILYGKNARRIFNHYKKLKVPKLERKWSDFNNLYLLTK